MTCINFKKNKPLVQVVWEYTHKEYLIILMKGMKVKTCNWWHKKLHSYNLWVLNHENICNCWLAKHVNIFYKYETQFAGQQLQKLWGYKDIFLWLHPVYINNKYIHVQIWCDFDRASLSICGNKMPTRCNRDFYCRSYCLLNMFRAPLCPSSGAQDYYTVAAACGISCCGFQVAGLVWSILQTGHITLSSTVDQQLENHSTKYHTQQPLYNTLELQMMGIMVPETCWASNKICNKNLCCI